jgi:hypothetical protein
MTSAVYDNALYHFGIGEVNFTTASRIWATLEGNTGPTKTHAHYSDIAAQLTATGNYVLGGATTTPGTCTVVSNVTQFDAPDAAWTAASFSAYFSIVDWGSTATTAANPLMSYHDLGGVQTVTVGTLTLVWAATGIFTLTSNAAA